MTPSMCGGATGLQNSQRGAAVVLAIICLLCVGVLVGTAVLLGLAERRGGQNFVGIQQAHGVAEAGAYHGLRAWDPVAYSQLALGTSRGFTGITRDLGAPYSGEVRRLSSLLYLITAEGTDTRLLSRQRVGVMARLNALQVEPKAALTIRGSLSIGSDAVVAGEDLNPLGWDCPGEAGVVAAVRLPPSDSAESLEILCPPASCVVGDPQIYADSSLTLDTLTTFDGLSLDRLRDLAWVVIPGGLVRPTPQASNETCITAASDNWGDPYGADRPCGRYYPLVHVAGDLEIRGGVGQGVLVVDGDLAVTDGFAFVGLVVVRGAFRSSGVGNRIAGALSVANTELTPIAIGGASVVQYSSCGLHTVLVASARVGLLREWGWFQVY